MSRHSIYFGLAAYSCYGWWYFIPQIIVMLTINYYQWQQWFLSIMTC